MDGSYIFDALIGHITPHRRCISLETNATVKDAILLLKQHDISALLIVDADSKKPVGWIDWKTLVLLQSLRPFTSLDPSDPTCVGFNEKFEYSSTRVGDLLAFSSDQSDRYFVVKDTWPISWLLEPFSKGTHRLLVSCGDDKAPTHYEVISQTDLYRFMCSNNEFKPLLDSTLTDLELFSGGPIVSMKSQESVLDGFRRCTEREYPALAIVSDEGKLIGNLSVTDLKGLDMDCIQDVLQPVTAFLQKHRKNSLDPVTCTRRDILRTVLTVMLTRSVHRVWVVDEQGKPSSCISMTDICGKMYRTTAPKVRNASQ